MNQSNQPSPLQNKSKELKEPEKKNKYWILVLILLLLLLTFFIQWKLKSSVGGNSTNPNGQLSAEELKIQKTLDSLGLDSLRIDSIRLDSLRAFNTLHSDSSRLDSLRKLRLLDSLILNSLRKDSINQLNAASNKVSSVKIGGNGGSVHGSFYSDSAQVANGLNGNNEKNESNSINPNLNDSLPPTLQVNPLSGRYFDQVKLKASCQDYTMKNGAKTKSDGCVIQYSLLDFKSSIPSDLSTLKYTAFSNQTISRSQVAILRALDKNKNSSTPVIRNFQIVPRNSTCGQNAVPVGGVTQDGPSQGFCIDEYEWPNKAGEKPKAFTSQMDAATACKSVGKRLCSAAEWKWSCQGPDKTKYSYGQSFEAAYCTSNSSVPGRSGRKKNCRSWYGAYDMGGNVWEWTSTPSPKRSKYFVVSGGSWKSVSQTSCGTTKYSFFPQNEYPMVGFRCCSDQK